MRCLFAPCLILCCLPAFAGAQKQGKSQPIKPSDRRSRESMLFETLRYDDKPFRHWPGALRSEVKPARRVEALKAMGAFGQNGLAEAAARAAFDALLSYDLGDTDREDASVVEAAYAALRKCGDPALRLLLARAKGEDRKQRDHAFGGLRAMGTKAEPAGPELMKLFAHDDEGLALRAMGLVVSPAFDGVSRSGALLAALRDALRSPQPKRRLAAVSCAARNSLGALAFSLYVTAASDPDAAVRSAGLAYLGDSDHRHRIPALARLLRSEHADVRRTAFSLLRDSVTKAPSITSDGTRKPRDVLRDNAEVIMTPLNARLRQGGSGAVEALEVVTVLGATASPALPHVKRLMTDKDDTVAARARAAHDAVTGAKKDKKGPLPNRLRPFTIPIPRPR